MDWGRANLRARGRSLRAPRHLQPRPARRGARALRGAVRLPRGGEVNCPACGHANPERAKFCAECGAAFGLHCASCGSELPPTAKFCLECGRPAGAGAEQGTERARPPRSALAYTPRHLADKILASKAALEGERKQVTVLFADVRSSMELAEAVDPEEWHRILDGFFSVLADGIHRFEGTINQYTGDGIMALFGAPIAHEDHAQRACFAALHL